MAFDDFRRVIEDTIRVDMKKRWTPQLVRFINNRNEFYGFFNGEISATGGFLSDVNLSNITIYKSDGSELDIDEVIEMRDRLDIYDIHFMNLSTVVSIDLPSKIQSKVNELSVEVYNSINNLSCEFFEKIQSSNEEVYKTITDVSNLISVRIDNVEANLLSNKLELKADISQLNEKMDQKVDEIYLSIDTFEQNTKNEFEQTSAYFNNKILNDKHYSFNTVNTNTEPFKIKDFAINSIKCSVKDGSVFHNEIEIGRIEEVKKIDNEIKSLNFVTYDDIKDEEIRKCFPPHSTTYHFDNTKNSYEIQYGYTMTINFTNSNEISDISFSLTRHQTSYRPVFLDNIYVGSIVNEQKDSNGNIISGRLEIQSGGIEKLSKFNHKIIDFNENNKILTFKNEDNSLSNSIIVNSELRKVILLDNFSSERKIPIHNLCCDYIDIGYIKESDIKENEFTIIISKENILSNFSGFSTFNSENGFKVDKDIDYSIKYAENCIIGYERQLYYNYNLSCYNISNEINKTNIVIIPELKNRLINEYSFDALSVRFTDTDINDFPYNNTIVLSRSDNFENQYETDKGTMTIKFNETNNLINIVVDFKSGPEWNEEYFWSVDSKKIESNNDKIIFKSQNIDINNPEPQFEVVNTEPEKVYNLEFGILEENNFEPFTLMVNSEDAKSIVVELPKNEYSDNVSQEFIIRFEIDTPTKMLVPLKFHNNETVEFGKLNKNYLEQIYLNTEDTTTLLFNQLPSKGGVSHYIVQDLNNNLIDERFIKLNNDLINETNDRISNDTDLSNWIIKEEKVRYANDLILSNQVDFLSNVLSTEIKDRYDNDLILSNQVEFLSGEISDLSGDYIKTKEKYGSDISWIFNRISCVINHMGVLTIDSLQQSTATLKDVFHINEIVGVPLSAGWFYTVKSSTEYKDYYFIDGTKIGNGDFIKIKHDLSSVDNIQLSDVTITDIMDSDVVHQKQLNDTLLSVTTISSTLSTEIKDRYDNDTDLSNWCDNLSVKLDNEISNRISNDTDLSNWIIKEEKVRLSNDTDLSNWCVNLSVKLDNEISDRISNDTDLSNWIIKEEKVRYDNDLILSNQVDFLSNEISTLNNDFNTVSSDYNTFIKSTFTSLCSEHHDSSIKNLCILDEEHIEEGHDKYYMTFKKGTLVLVKIK